MTALAPSLVYTLSQAHSKRNSFNSFNVAQTFSLTQDELLTVIMTEFTEMSLRIK